MKFKHRRHTFLINLYRNRFQNPHTMKKLLIITGLCLIISLANSQETIKAEIFSAINSGDEEKLSSNFNSSIDLSLPDFENSVSKNHGKQILKNFFKKNPPKKYAHNHQGISKDGSIYIIGTYTATNKAFRTYFLIKKTKGNYKIVQVQFEEQKLKL